MYIKKLYANKHAIVRNTCFLALYLLSLSKQYSYILISLLLLKVGRNPLSICNSVNYIPASSGHPDIHTIEVLNKSSGP